MACLQALTAVKLDFRNWLPVSQAFVPAIIRRHLFRVPGVLAGRSGPLDTLSARAGPVPARGQGSDGVRGVSDAREGNFPGRQGRISANSTVVRYFWA
jgi:hypothetical protein